MNKILERLSTLGHKRHNYIVYMQEKIAERDWHGVADIAMDLRDLEVEYTIYKEQNEIFQPEILHKTN